MSYKDILCCKGFVGCIVDWLIVSFVDCLITKIFIQLVRKCVL